MYTFKSKPGRTRLSLFEPISAQFCAKGHVAATIGAVQGNAGDHGLSG